MSSSRWYRDVPPNAGSAGHGEYRPAMNWQRFMTLMDTIRGRWDVAILANLAAGTSRPSDLLDAINAQSMSGHRLTWKVMRERLRHLEQAGYVGRQDISRFPRETRYWMTGFACRLLTELDALDTWYAANAPSLRTAAPRQVHANRTSRFNQDNLLQRGPPFLTAPAADRPSLMNDQCPGGGAEHGRSVPQARMSALERPWPPCSTREILVKWKPVSSASHRPVRPASRRISRSRLSNASCACCATPYTREDDLPQSGGLVVVVRDRQRPDGLEGRET